MLNKLEKYLSEQNILNDDATYMVGFSGGFDSCALLHMLASLRTKYDFRLCAAHLNHGWRETSNEEALNCYNFCQKYDIEFYTEKLNEDVPKTETAARDARYQFFERAANHFGTNILLTAHTKSDNIETIVYRITKGTGISGLCGIDSVRESNGLKIYRPLLSDSRKDIEEYCKDNYLSPNVDESNFDTKYKRNFIRHEILPLLMQINQHADSAINTLIENAIADNDIIKEYIAQINKTLTSDNKISTKKFVSQSKEVQQRLIYDFVLSKGLDYDKKKICEILEFINDNAESKSGKTMSLTTDLWLFCSKDEIYTITENGAPIDTIVEINDWKDKYHFENLIFTIEEFDADEVNFPRESLNYALVDLSEQSHLELRFRKEGDRIQPFGMQETIKLKDFFINKGIPQHQKDRIILLCNKEEVLWACYVGLSEKLRVKTRPTHIIRIEEV